MRPRAQRCKSRYVAWRCQQDRDHEGDHVSYDAAFCCVAHWNEGGAAFAPLALKDLPRLARVCDHCESATTIRGLSLELAALVEAVTGSTTATLDHALRAAYEVRRPTDPPCRECDGNGEYVIEITRRTARYGEYVGVSASCPACDGTGSERRAVELLVGSLKSQLANLCTAITGRPNATVSEARREATARRAQVKP